MNGWCGNVNNQQHITNTNCSSSEEFLGHVIHLENEMGGNWVTQAARQHLSDLMTLFSLLLCYSLETKQDLCLKVAKYRRAQFSFDGFSLMK